MHGRYIGELLLGTDNLTILVVMVIDFEDNVHLQVVEMTTKNNAPYELGCKQRSPIYQ